MNLQVDIDLVGWVTVINLVGEELKEDDYGTVTLSVIRQVESSSRHIIIDMAQIRSVDSVGLGALVRCLKAAAEHGGSVTLVCSDAHILEVLDITGLSKIFGIYPTRDEAIQRLAATVSDDETPDPTQQPVSRRRRPNRGTGRSTRRPGR